MLIKIKIQSHKNQNLSNKSISELDSEGNCHIKKPKRAVSKHNENTRGFEKAGLPLMHILGMHITQ